jgi:hypothetical protein
MRWLRHVSGALTVAWLACAVTSAACAADIRFASVRDGVAAITLQGEIDPGDDDVFGSVARTVPRDATVVVLLASPGGNLLSALGIGTLIHASGMMTFVPDDATCASACGLIWLAGRTRLISSSGRVGLHAAWRGDDQERRESGSGNAVAGAYLAKLGFDYDFIAFASSAPPDEMRWLHPAEAKKYGIAYRVLPAESDTRFGNDAASGLPPDARTAPVGEPGAPAPTGPEAAALHFLLALFDRLSRATSASFGSDIGRVYADSLMFYGERQTRAQIVAAEATFLTRWPVHEYRVLPDSVSLHCAASTCEVAATIGWDCRSAERNSHSVGTASVSMTLDMTGPAPIIVRESGQVIHRDVTALSADAASAGTATAVSIPGGSGTSYADGLRDRTAYETWFNGLGPEQRQGAAFWAENRSRIARGEAVTCRVRNASVPFVEGCTEARDMLSMFDRRRLADGQYRAGWNSLP